MPRVYEAQVGSGWHCEAAPETNSRPWAAAARTLVLYNPGAEWRYAIYNDDGIIDGVLLGAPAGITTEEAQQLLLGKVEELTGNRYVATWIQDKFQWWSAELAVES